MMEHTLILALVFLGVSTLFSMLGVAGGGIDRGRIPDA